MDESWLKLGAFKDATVPRNRSALQMAGFYDREQQLKMIERDRNSESSIGYIQPDIGQLRCHKLCDEEIAKLFPVLSLPTPEERQLIEELAAARATQWRIKSGGFIMNGPANAAQRKLIQEEEEREAKLIADRKVDREVEMMNKQHEKEEKAAEWEKLRKQREAATKKAAEELFDRQLDRVLMKMERNGEIA
jgi:hypothetical protein